MTAFPERPGQPLNSRFAPSPTGRLHLGHAYSALLAHNRARRTGGGFVLRVEDIDGGRSRPEHVDGIVEDLRWLGLDWDALLLQSERAGAHRQALDALIDQGLAYRCACTRADIAAAGSAPQGDLSPVYPGTCRERRIAADDPRPAAWRLDMNEALRRAGPLTWRDELAGELAARPEAFGDVVIARKDAGTSYHLAATVDDAVQGIGLVVRGRDLFAATHIHRLLQALLGLPTPRYHHHALILDADGKRLAKRTPSSTLAELRDSGVCPDKLRADLRRGALPTGFAFDAP